MIITEFYQTRDDGIDLYYTHSDSGFMLRQIETDLLYNEAIDIEGSLYTYEETDIPNNLIQPVGSENSLKSSMVNTETENAYEEEAISSEDVTMSEGLSAEEFMALLEEVF